MLPKQDKGNTKRTADIVAETLIASIVRGDLAVGARLQTERELCESFNTSRPTVREAIARIQLMGYATNETGKRPLVSLPSVEKILTTTGQSLMAILGDAEGLAHLEQMRQFIETGAVREVAKNTSNSKIAKIKSALDANFAAIGKPSFGETDIKFHRAIVAIVENPIMLTLHDMFVSRMVAVRAPVTDQAGRDSVVYDEHCAVFESMLRGDEVTAITAMDQHLSSSFRRRLIATNSTQPH